jgi:serine phosphatase RsbU (regulator of sigma subunit)
VAWRTMVLAGRPAEETLATLSELLEHERQDDTMFATLCMTSVHPDRTSGWVRMAGHLPPLLLSRGGVSELPTQSAAPLGLSDGRAWPGTQIRLDGSWSILLYTDGLIEGRIGKGSERLGSEGLMDLIRDALGAPDKPGEELLDQVIHRVRELNGRDLDDDLAVLALGFSSPDEP